MLFSNLTNRKTLLTLLLTITLLVSSLSLSALGSNTAIVTVTANQTSARAGDDVTFTVSVSDVENLKSLKVSVKKLFDKYTQTSDKNWGAWLSAISNKSILDDVNTNGDAVAAFEKSIALNNNIFQFTLTAKENIPSVIAHLEEKFSIRMLDSSSNDINFKLVCEAKLALPFTDVKETSWYYSTIQEIYSLGLMTGTTSTKFAPTAPMTRAMATVVLYRMSGSPEVTFETIFKDVADGKYYSDSVTWASQNNIINGYAVDNTFRPGQNVTREQMAVILYNYIKSLGFDMSTNKDLSTFHDNNKVATYARTAMSWAVGNGLLSGTKEGNLEPKEQASRAECAKMLLKTYEIIQNQ